MKLHSDSDPGQILEGPAFDATDAGSLIPLYKAHRCVVRPEVAGRLIRGIECTREETRAR